VAVKRVAAIGEVPMNKHSLAKGQCLAPLIHPPFPPLPGISSAAHPLFALSPARLRYVGAFVRMRRRERPRRSSGWRMRKERRGMTALRMNETMGIAKLSSSAYHHVPPLLAFKRTT
jgi:hypothetical protein